MKDPNRAPAYAVIYHGLCDVARQHGYALAIHGSVITDLDLIAVPWVEDACAAQELVEAIRAHCQACLNLGDSKVGVTAIKPHGRLAWNLYMGAGAKVDLSVLPRVED
jgi:hypothetical protein